GMHAAPTVQGGELMLSTKDGKLMVEDGQGNVATVIQADVMQSNGVVHVIDTVLMPGM
ncbi:MAG TPA: fasciclin domain-containing protein, partial [Marinobacter sp.]|nr:fasciclin domain-containing protein [Marinobacter sp.]